MYLYIAYVAVIYPSSHVFTKKINKLLLLLWGTKRIKVAITQFISFEIIKKTKRNCLCLVATVDGREHINNKNYFWIHIIFY